MRHYAPFIDDQARRALENAETARLRLVELRTAWESNGSPRNGAEEAGVALAFAVYKDATAWASAESKRCIASWNFQTRKHN